jgi:hypothetical protein
VKEQKECMTKGCVAKRKRQCMNGNSIVREPPKFKIVEAKINGDVGATSRLAKKQ